MVKVGISGAHGTGKTTLMQAWREKHPDWEVVTEVARGCPFPLNEKANFDTQNYILNGQISTELARSKPYGDMICDRTTLDQIAYIDMARTRGNMTVKQADFLYKHCKVWSGTYDFIFYIPIEFPMECDGVRSPDLEFQKSIDAIVNTQFKYMCFENEFARATEEALTLRGSVNERIERLERVIIHKEF